MMDAQKESDHQCNNRLALELIMYKSLFFFFLLRVLLNLTLNDVNVNLLLYVRTYVKNFMLSAVREL